MAQRLWNEDCVSYESGTCILDRVRMTLKCVQHPHPPIWFAAKHPNAIKRAARLGDCLYHSPKATLTTHQQRLKLSLSERQQLGKPLPSENPARVEIFCAKDRATALEMARPYISERYQAYAHWERDQAMPEAERINLPLDE